MPRSEEAARVREWARANGHTIPNRGRIPARILRAYADRDTRRPSWIPWRRQPGRHVHFYGPALTGYTERTGGATPVYRVFGWQPDRLRYLEIGLCPTLATAALFLQQHRATGRTQHGSTASRVA